MNASGLDQDYEVSEKQIAAFRRDGHIVLPGLATATAIDAYRPAILEAAEAKMGELAPLEERSTLGKAFLQIWHLCESDARVNAFVTAHRFAKAAADIMGVEAVRLYHDQVLFKEPGGGPTPWHQDQYYIPLDTENVVTMWMPLIDVTAEMGTMDHALGSQMNGPLADVPTSEETDAIFEPMIADRGWPVRSCGAMRAGDASFHRGWTVHRARGNSSDTMREVMTILYYEDGARLKSELSDMERYIAKVHISGKEAGEVADGALNPLIYRR